MAYANAVDGDETVGKYPSRYAFFREMDEGLEVRGEERGEVVEAVVGHVGLLREVGEEVVRGRREVREGLLIRGEGEGEDC